MSSRYDGFRLLLFWLSATCFAATASGVMFWSGRGILPVYMVTLLGAITAVTGWAAFSESAPRKTYPAFDLAAAFALLALAAALRFPHLGTVPLWSDEDLQNWFVLRHVNIVYMAAYGQQPPLHHYLALAVMKIFGVSLFNLRFFTALFGCLAVPLFYFLLYRLGIHRALALCGALLFLTNNWLVSYSQEAKPYMMAIFLAVVWLSALADFLRAPPGWKSAAGVTASGILFLYTVGVQPMLFFFLGSALVLAVLRRADETKFRLFAVSTVVSFGAFVPDLYAIRLLSAAKGYIRPFPGLAAYFGNLWAGLPGFWQELQEILGASAWLYLLAAAGTLLVARRLGRTRPPATQAAVALGFSGALLFPPAIYAFFRLFITLDIMFYYLILVWPLLFLAALSAAECGRTFCIERWPGRPGRRAANFFIVLVAIGSSALAWAEYRKPSAKIAEANIPGLFQYWREHAAEGSLAFYFTVNESPPTPKISPHIGFIGTDYYYTPDVARNVALSSAWDRQLVYATQMDPIFDEIESPTEPRQFYFYAFNRENEFDYAAAKFSAGLAAYGRHNFDPAHSDWAADTLLRIENKWGSRETLKRFFTEVAAQAPRASFNLKAYTALAAIAIQEGRCGPAAEYLPKIHALCAADFTDCRAEPRIRKNYLRLCPAVAGQKAPLW